MLMSRENKVWIISDTHLKHAKVATYCQRPPNFTELIDTNVKRIVQPNDILIHVGDVGIDKAEGEEGFMKIVRTWPGKKWLVRGNHDQKAPGWYVEHGFDWCGDAMIFRGAWITHKPWMKELPEGCHVNIHGHLHNIWHGFVSTDPAKADPVFVEAVQKGRLPRPWHRLFAIEYTNYSPVEFDKFIAKPDKFLARGPAGRKHDEDGKEGMKLLESVPDGTGDSTEVEHGKF